MATVAASSPARTTVDVRTLGLRVTVLGAAAQLAGIAVDAWLHARDATLAAREGIFSLDNVGHALLVVGISLVIVGATLAILGRQLQDRPVARLAVPLVLVALLGAGTAFGATSSLAHGHDEHVATAADASHSHAAPSHTDAASPVPGLLTHSHADPADVPVDRATRDQLAAQLVTARAVALRFPTVTDAEKAGYHKVTPYIPGIAAHYMNFGLVDGTFDVEHPEMLLFDGTDPGSRIVGLSYYVLSPSEPAGFAGPNDHWHRHIGLCISRTQILVIGGENTTPEECAARGGYKADGSNAWMNHTWVVPGWESPRGVFSAENPDLK